MSESAPARSRGAGAASYPRCSLAVLGLELRDVRLGAVRGLRHAGCPLLLPCLQPPQRRDQLTPAKAKHQ